MKKSSGYRFRRFNPKFDTPAICEFHKEHILINFPGTLYKQDLFIDQLRRASEREPEGMMVLENDEREIVGFLWLQTVFDVYKDASYGDLHYLHIAPGYRGIGLGSLLMEKADSYFRSKKAPECRLGTHVDNAVAIQLYRKFGFRNYRVIMVKASEG